MDMIKRIRRSAFLFASAILFIGFFDSCDKQQDTLGVITVKDSAGVNVHNALVRLHGEPSDSLYAGREVQVDKEARTNPSGVARFNFNQYYKEGQSGLMVLDITVTKDSLQVTDYIEIKEGEENTKTVRLEP